MKIECDDVKFESMLSFAKKAKEYFNQEECDDPEEWMIDLFSFCESFVELFDRKVE